VYTGPGSTLDFATEAMAGLHVIITELKEKLGVQRIRMLDIPCGDMVWMRRFLEAREDISYTGIDIVPVLYWQSYYMFDCEKLAVKTEI